jgi:hypothetical protein
VQRTRGEKAVEAERRRSNAKGKGMRGWHVDMYTQCTVIAAAMQRTRDSHLNCDSKRRAMEKCETRLIARELAAAIVNRKNAPKLKELVSKQ